MFSSLYNKLTENGYHITPVIPRGKAPLLPNWSNPDTVIEIEKYKNCNVGIVTGNTIAVDIDIKNIDLSDAVHTLCKHITKSTPPLRVGAPPKKLLVFRTLEPFTKMKSDVFEEGHIEILGEGQQFVAYGVHPYGIEYKWESQNLLYVKSQELPLIDKETASKLIQEFNNFCRSKNCRLLKETKLLKANNNYDVLDAVKTNTSFEDITKMLNLLDPDCDRETWRNVGFAVHYETNGKGFDLWNTWSSKGSKYKPGECEKQWASFGKNKSRPITFAYVLDLTKEKRKALKNKELMQKLNWSVSRFVEDPEPIPMIIENVLPKGIVSMFYAPGGVGKSTLILWLAVNIVIADENSKVFDCRINQGSVLILTAEDPDNILNIRYNNIVQSISDKTLYSKEEIKSKLNEELFICSTFGNQLSLFDNNKNKLKSTEFYNFFLSHAKQIKNLSLIVIDTRSRYSNAEEINNNQLKDEIGFYEKIVSSTKASVMFLHHNDKNSRIKNTPTSSSYRGGSTMADNIRFAWSLRKPIKDKEVLGDIEDKYVLECTKNNYCKVHKPFLLTREGYFFNFNGKITEKTKEEKEVEAENNIMQLILSVFTKEELNQTQFFEKCADHKISRVRAKKTLNLCIDLGYIACCDCGKGRSKVYKLIKEGV